MIQVIPSSSRYTADHGWLTSRFSFSFAEYHDPANVQFGHLRVLNDDIVQAGRGFGTHPHRDMEIVTYVLEGTLEHQDSMGNKGVLKAGEVQCMTAGTGILHSEYNASETDPVHFLQIWVFPRHRGLTPTYDQRAFDVKERTNQWTPLVSGGSLPDTLHINQDAVFQAAMLQEGQELRYNLTGRPKAHLFVIEGSVTLNQEHVLQAGDAARISDMEQLHLAASSSAHLLLIEMGSL